MEDFAKHRVPQAAKDAAPTTLNLFLTASTIAKEEEQNENGNRNSNKPKQYMPKAAHLFDSFFEFHIRSSCDWQSPAIDKLSCSFTQSLRSSRKGHQGHKVCSGPFVSLCAFCARHLRPMTQISEPEGDHKPVRRRWIGFAEFGRRR